MRVFIINDDDTLRRLPNAKYERMLRYDPEESLRQYADKRIRYALVIFETENRKPTKIIRIQYSYLFFDSNGFLDKREKENEMRLGVNMLSTFEAGQGDRNVIHAQHKFAQRKHKNRYTWTPSRELEMTIVDAVLKM